MNDGHGNAEEDLRVIRTLMERATVYRAISAPSALVAGLLSAAAAGFIYYNNAVHMVLGRLVRPHELVMIWLAVLLLAAAANAYFLWSEASRTRRPFVSSGMKLALRAIIPNLLVPVAYTAWFYSTGYQGANEDQLVVCWVAFYGLALLSTQLFAPNSIGLLGWAFLLTSVAVPSFQERIDDLVDDLPSFLMGMTFGLYHLVYAVCTWPRRGEKMGAPPLSE